MYDVLIIGAGVVGTAIARRLSRYQLKIAILEAENDVAMGSSKANSAIVHGGYAEANAKLKGRVCYQGRRQYAQLDKELNFGFRETGSLVIRTGCRTSRSWSTTRSSPSSRTSTRTSSMPFIARVPASAPPMR